MPATIFLLDRCASYGLPDVDLTLDAFHTVAYALRQKTNVKHCCGKKKILVAFEHCKKSWCHFLAATGVEGQHKPTDSGLRYLRSSIIEGTVLK